jgi:hypothetical protein
MRNGQINIRGQLIVPIQKDLVKRPIVKQERKEKVVVKQSHHHLSNNN